MLRRTRIGEQPASRTTTLKLTIPLAWTVTRNSGLRKYGTKPKQFEIEGEEMKFDLRIGRRLFGLGLSSARGLFYSTLVLGLALIFSMPVAAQRITGTLRGQVLDPS